MKTAFAFCADLHLKRNIWTNRPEIENDTLCSFTQIVDYCISNDLPLVSGGDNFDNTKPTSSLVSYLQNEICKLQLKGLHFYSVDGNHDKATPSWLDIVGGRSLDKDYGAPLNIRGMTIAGLDHCGNQQELADRLSKVPKVDILVCHQLLDLACKLEGMANMCALDVPSYIKTVLMGDYHVKGKWINTHKTNFFYPGSIAKLSTSESHSKYFYVVEKYGLGDHVVLESIPIVTRYYREFVIDSLADLGDMLLEYNKAKFADDPRAIKASKYPEIAKGIIRVLYNPQLTEVVSKVREAITTHHLMFQPIIKSGDAVVEIDTLGNLAPLSVLRSMIPPADKELYEFCADFVSIKGVDYKEAFDHLRAVYGVTI